MSNEEKSALGLTDQITNRLVETYKSTQAVQNILSGASSSGLTSYA